ncbi:MAG: ATP-binding protein [Myxococcales bacterium]
MVEALLAPGFSTRAQITDLSGRGVGLAVVADVVRALSGTLTVDSEPGAGTRWAFAFSRL